MNGLSENVSMTLEDSKKVEDTTSKMDREQIIYFVTFITLLLIWYFIVVGYQ